MMDYNSDIERIRSMENEMRINLIEVVAASPYRKYAENEQMYDILFEYAKKYGVEVPDDEEVEFIYESYDIDGYRFTLFVTEKSYVSITKLS